MLNPVRKIVPEDKICLRVPKTSVPSFKVILHNVVYIAGEDDDHYLLPVEK